MTVGLVSQEYTHSGWLRLEAYPHTGSSVRGVFLIIAVHFIKNRIDQLLVGVLGRNFFIIVSGQLLDRHRRDLTGFPEKTGTAAEAGCVFRPHPEESDLKVE